MRVMTFNLRMNTPDDGPNAWPHRVKLVQQMIRNVDPDILGTQEVLPSMLADLEEALPEYEWTGDARRDGDERSAILFKRDRFEMLSSRTFWLSETPDVPGSVSWQSSLPRICTYGVFQEFGSSRPPFAFFNAHLDHVSDMARVHGLAVILRKMQEVWEQDKIRRMVLTGDFNDFPSSPALSSMREAEIADRVKLMNSYQTSKMDEIGKTFHGFNGGAAGEPIDYIFHTETLDLREVIIHRDAFEGRYPSDHYPVSADILL